MTPSTLPSPPDRSHHQRQLALAQANDIRSFRASFKRDLKLCEDTDLSRKRVAEIVMDPPPKMVTMKVIDLLVACPKVGPTKANRMIRKAVLSPSKTLGGLTQRQRLSLRAELL